VRRSIVVGQWRIEISLGRSELDSLGRLRLYSSLALIHRYDGVDALESIQWPRTVTAAFESIGWLCPVGG
jgi:hypothetical protein